MKWRVDGVACGDGRGNGGNEDGRRCSRDKKRKKEKRRTELEEKRGVVLSEGEPCERSVRVRVCVNVSALFIRSALFAAILPDKAMNPRVGLAKRVLAHSRAECVA